MDNSNRNVKILSPFMTFCQKVIPLAYDESLSYYECLCGLVNYIKNEVTPAVNQNADAVTELQNFVSNYFDNLNVQEEINNKLDEMANSGKLAEIINAFIQSNSIIGFDNIEKMKESTLLINGSFARTYSKDNINDGKGGFYKIRTITSSDIVDDFNIIALNNDNTLIAERMINKDIDDLKQDNKNINDNINIINEDIVNINKKLNPIDFYKNKNLVVFGDSFSQPNIPNSVDAHWVNRVGEATGLIPKNFAIAGAGFARTSNLLSSQLTTALQQMTEEEINNTAVVIIYAGCNDILNNIAIQDIEDKATEFINSVCDTFTKAKVILAPFNWSFNYLSYEKNIKMQTLINKISRNISNKPVVVLKLARYWCLGIKAYYQNSVHPNEAGYNKIAGNFINAIYGGSEHVTIGDDISSQLLHGSENSKIFNYQFEDGNVYLYFSVSFSSTLNNYSSIMMNNLPPLLCPDHDIFIPLYKVDDYQDCGYLRLTTGGVLTIHINNLPANTTICATPITFKASANTEY